MTTPSPPAGVLDRGGCLDEVPLGIVLVADDAWELLAGLVRFDPAVGSDGFVEPARRRECGGLGMAELVDPKGERVVARIQVVTTALPGDETI